MEREVFDIAFLDLRLGTDSGIDLLPNLLERLPSLKVIMITAYATIESAVEAMRRGAADYLPKPFQPAQVRLVLQKAADLHSLERQVESLRDTIAGSHPPLHVESKDKAMASTIELLRRVAATDATILLLGESGTGKGMFARAMHDWSQRREGPFVIVHTPSLSAELLESELFGHVKGAFTGAVQANLGRVAQAEGGTIFLDEIGELPMPLQTKLLRFLQDREYERVGDSHTRHADVRIIAATNQDLGRAMEQGRFREDLYYRLNVVEARIPPLRERVQDMAALAEEFLAHYGHKYNRKLLRFSPDGMNALRRYDWPGNVRELGNAIERAVILADGDEIRPEAFPFINAGEAISEPAIGKMISLSELEEAHIKSVIQSTETLDQAAEVLGIDPATLWRRRQKYNI